MRWWAIIAALRLQRAQRDRAKSNALRPPQHKTTPPPLIAAASTRSAATKASKSLWLAQNPSKRWAEVFFLAYSPFWILWALCILVPFQLYEVRACLAAQSAVGSDVAAIGRWCCW